MQQSNPVLSAKVWSPTFTNSVAGSMRMREYRVVTFAGGPPATFPYSA